LIVFRKPTISSLFVMQTNRWEFCRNWGWSKNVPIRVTASFHCCVRTLSPDDLSSRCKFYKSCFGESFKLFVVIILFLEPLNLVDNLDAGVEKADFE
jgi:hypothetical protein